MSYILQQKVSFGADNWCLRLRPLYQAGVLAALSNGHVHLVDWATGKSVLDVAAHESSINGLQVLDSAHDRGTVFATAADDGVKLFDIRTRGCVATLTDANGAPALSLDSRHGMLAFGTELVGVDAVVSLFALGEWGRPLRAFVDSHHDDVTDVKFHPTDSNLLLSGSTDGYVNVYDLKQSEEDEALHQVINFASIHSCGWLSPKRIWSLSHMETFAIHELNDKSEHANEPQPQLFGDVREPWACDYVVDVYPGFIAAGSTRENAGELRLLPLRDECVDAANAIVLPQAHGDEVVRDVLVPASSPELLYSAGEDGNMAIWKSTLGPLNVPVDFWDYSKKETVLEDLPSSGLDDTHSAQHNDQASSLSGQSQPEQQEYRQVQSDGMRRNRSSKHSKKHSARFTPY
ncbi:ADL218Cp [Eremothecium gossypii ATCC 10895]|uniref:ADL218Cp n=1 Tax=Eremothecium gossypii (strain ATCC 10895 / CBS 109.51 / FGSC 9923 / NRRL Y-1056) TaxID=284811 RepID=Q75AY8_EREGS|nr:ADL218Cp [Eremothecium gossypii ATCC 10895]AAS51702.1 ADL218Cp [Eremothecium gossypii ATCC 10895]AEY95999.1 FADL218Cp [Eremothecium gossypii FDAG1]